MGFGATTVPAGLERIMKKDKNRQTGLSILNFPNHMVASVLIAMTVC
jgi:hypothetical protein